MKNYTHIFSIIVKSIPAKGFGLNTNFLEANVINIGLLLFGLIYVLKNFLGVTLLNRQEKVITAIQESEERLQQANVRLAESEKQLSQTQLVIQQIEKEAKITAYKVRESILEQGKLDINRLTLAGKESIKIAESQVKQQIQQQITTLAIRKVVIKLKNQINLSIQSKIIDNSIINIGEEKVYE
uniref:ATP synthase CFO B chain subunit I n=1 Tax=Sporolithon durum TaxID=48970 RepID=A0A141SCU1_9FLOR|nr:ATP synthase CFO B chain subunit I [Sporolithon durum]AMK96109.1 ATP synthase CFO B chain subunit I [Sporolithon durum]